MSWLWEDLWSKSVQAEEQTLSAYPLNSRSGDSENYLTLSHASHMGGEEDVSQLDVSPTQALKVNTG